MTVRAASIVEPTRLVQGRELRQAASSPPVFSASCLCPCPTSALHSPHNSVNLQYDVGAGLRLSHKSGAIVPSPPTRSPGASSAGTRVRGMQCLLSLAKAQQATDGEGMKKEARRGRKKILRSAVTNIPIC
jgi:hypothetical protein